MEENNIFKQSKVKYIIVILLLQSFFTIAITLMSHLEVIQRWNKVFLHIILFIAIVLAILAVIFIQEIYELAKNEIKLKTKEAQLEENKRLIKELRTKKHDFSNHLQTIYGMLQLNKHQKAKKYIKSLTKDLHDIQEKNLKTNDTIFDSVLNYKRSIAKGKGLDFNYHFESGFVEIDLNLKDIFKILTNLVDNAIEAAKAGDGKATEIIVKGKNESDQYILSVYNQGSYISNEKKELIFKPGFSTKEKKKGDKGFGLHIIKRLIEKAQGKIEVVSGKDYGTEFICYFPKSK